MQIVYQYGYFYVALCNFFMTIKSDMIYIKRIDASKIREYISLESRMMVE